MEKAKDGFCMEERKAIVMKENDYLRDVMRR